MIIERPYIEIKGEETYLCSEVTDEVKNKTDKIFFSVSNEFGEYLCDEVADAFLVAMLLPALVSGQDIKVDAKISDRILFQIENSLLPALGKVFNHKPINISPEDTSSINYNSSAVATGFSGGVDSFSTVLQHISLAPDREMKLTHLSLFNVGSYGDDKIKSYQAFLEDVKRARIFAKDVNLPLLILNSNISEAYHYEELKAFTRRATISIIAGVLSMQKLFKHYLIASGSPTIDEIALKKKQAYYDILLGAFLSTNNTNIVISDADLTRIDKLHKIIDSNYVKQYLYVCASDIYNIERGTKFNKGNFENCSECEKCTMTLMTLDVIGRLDDFKERFNLEKYYKKKDRIFAKMIYKRNKNVNMGQIYRLVKQNTPEIITRYRFAVLVLKIKGYFSQYKVFRNIYKSMFKR